MNKPKLTTFVQSGDRKAASELIGRITKRLDELRKSQGEDKAIEHVNKIKHELSGLSKKNKSAAQAFLDELDDVFPEYDWAISQ